MGQLTPLPQALVASRSAHSLLLCRDTTSAFIPYGLGSFNCLNNYIYKFCLSLSLSAWSIPTKSRSGPGWTAALITKQWICTFRLIRAAATRVRLQRSVPLSSDRGCARVRAAATRRLPPPRGTALRTRLRGCGAAREFRRRRPTDLPMRLGRCRQVSQVSWLTRKSRSVAEGRAAARRSLAAPKTGSPLYPVVSQPKMHHGHSPWKTKQSKTAPPFGFPLM